MLGQSNGYGQAIARHSHGSLLLQFGTIHDLGRFQGHGFDQDAGIVRQAKVKGRFQERAFILGLFEMERERERERVEEEEVRTCE